MIVGGQLRDIALVDAVVTTDIFTGSRAVWEVSHIKEAVFVEARPDSIGLSSIGAAFAPLVETGRGMHVVIGEGGWRVQAPIGPGVVERVPVRTWRTLAAGEMVTVEHTPCTIALDGEREIMVHPGERVDLRLSDEGPWWWRCRRFLAAAMQAGTS